MMSMPFFRVFFSVLFCALLKSSFSVPVSSNDKQIDAIKIGNIKPTNKSTEEKSAGLVTANQREEEEQVLDSADFDKNQNGCIDGDEELGLFTQKVASALDGTPNNLVRAENIVRRIDGNQDKKICWCDFISVYLQERSRGNNHLFPFLVIPDENLFVQLDRNMDGKLTDKEADQLLQEFKSCMTEVTAEAIFTTLTGLVHKDKDIDLLEFLMFFDMLPPTPPNIENSFIQPPQMFKQQNTGYMPPLPPQIPPQLQQDRIIVPQLLNPARQLPLNTKQNKMASNDVTSHPGAADDSQVL